MAKILLFGKSGQLGKELERSLALIGQVVAPLRSAVGGDFRDGADLSRLVREMAPDIVVNAAAFTDVDGAQSQRALAFAVNADAPAILARACSEVGAWLVHYSSDYVFDGSGITPWRESDRCSPLNVYGESKLLGEKNVASLCARHLIIRTSWLHSGRGVNFPAKVLEKLRRGEPLKVVDDQTGAPTSARWLADLSTGMLQQTLAQPGLGGLYHACSSGETSWYSYACFVLEHAMRSGRLTAIDAEMVTPVHSSAFAPRAQRPLNSRLDTRKLQRVFDLPIQDWRTGVLATLGQLT